MINLTKNQQKILSLLQDHRWHTKAEIISAGGSCGDRRFRDLRDFGYDVVTKRNPLNKLGPHLYGLNPIIED